MISFYTWSNLLRISAAVVLLMFLVPAVFIVHNSWRKRIPALPCMLIIIIQGLVPLTPFPFVKSLMQTGALLLLPSGLIWLLFLIHDIRKPDMHSYHAWIIDSLREAVLVFDSRLNLQGSTGIIANLKQDFSSVFIEKLRKILKSDREAQDPAAPRNEKILRFQERVYRCRYRPVEDGWLFTLLDFTEEQLLLDELIDKNRILEQQSSFLKATEEVELSIRLERYRQKVSSRIQNLLRKKLHHLLSLINGSDDLDPVLACAEDAMTEIRCAVGQLASEGEKP